jgi:purine-cytosine permease-like protein
VKDPEYHLVTNFNPVHVPVIGFFFGLVVGFFLGNVYCYLLGLVA